MSTRDIETPVSVQVDTRLGALRLQWLGDAVCRLEWVAPSASAESCAPWSELFAQASPAQRRVVEDLVDYTEGEYVSFRDTSVALQAGTLFQRRIWRACQQIPYGETVTYGQLAELAGYPGAARAVGGAMSKNQIPLIIPCHRVVAAGNKLGGFSSPQGITLKKRLLQMEQHGFVSQEKYRATSATKPSGAA